MDDHNLTTLAARLRPLILGTVETTSAVVNAGGGGGAAITELLIPTHVHNSTDDVNIYHVSSNYGVLMPDNKVSTAYGEFYVPQSWAGSSITIEAVAIGLTGVSGNVFRAGEIEYNRFGDDFAGNSEGTDTFAAVSMPSGSRIMRVLQTITTTGVLAGDVASIYFSRDAVSASDTYSFSLRFAGWRLTYN
jgi:hypothetical protein